MASHKKFLRYYYWLILEFIKKHVKLILVSFFLSFLVIIGLISISPYIYTLFMIKKEIVGFSGNYNFKNLPEEITNKISNGLVFINEKNDIIPALASSWEVKDQGRTYRFHIKRNLFWSDDKPFTANDVNYNFSDVDVKVIDPYTLDFKLKKTLNIFPTYLTKPMIRYPLNGVAGLYKVSRFKTKYSELTDIYLAPNKNNLPILVYKFYHSDNDLLNAYKTGEINEFKTNRSETADFLSTWKNTSVVKTVDYSQVLTVFFNMNQKLLKENPDLRDAIISSIPTLEFLQKGESAYGPIPPNSWAYNPNLKKRIYNSDKSKKIFEKYKEASGGATLNLLTNYDYLDMADTVVEALKNTGFKINLKLISFNKKNDFDLLLAFWKVPTDPDQYYFWHSTQSVGNITNYNKPKIDKLLEDGRGTYITKDRAVIYQKFQEIFVDDPPAFFLYYPYVFEVKRK